MPLFYLPRDNWVLVMRKLQRVGLETATQAGGTSSQMLRLVVFVLTMGGLAMGIAALAMGLARQGTLDSSLRALQMCAQDGSCLGGSVHLTTLVVDGNITAPNIPNGTCVQTLNGVPPDAQFNIDVLAGTNMVVTPDAPNHAINISTTTSLVNITMLAVQGDTMLGMHTTCSAPMLPSCLDISNQTCTVPLDASCMPSVAMFDVLHVNSLVLPNNQSLVAPCSLAESVDVGTLVVNDLVLTGSFTCPLPSTGISQNCLDLGGYSCPLGQPLADSCIPASLNFTDLAVTHMLSVNLVQCAQPLDVASCLGPLVGDVTGPLDNTTVVALQGTPVDSTAPLSQAVLVFNGVAWTGTALTWSELNVGNTVVVRDASGNATVNVMNAQTVQPPSGSGQCLGLGEPGAATGACAKADVSLDGHSLTNVGAIYVDNLHSGGTLAMSNAFITLHADLVLNGNQLWFNNATNFYSTTPGVLQSDAALIVSNTLTAARYTAYSSLGIPTVVAGTGAGTGPTLTVTPGSTDCKLQVTVLTGTSPAANTVFTLTYRTAATGTLANGVVFSAASATAAALTGTSAPWVSAEALGAFAFRSGTVALAATTTYVWNFQTCA